MGCGASAAPTRSPGDPPTPTAASPANVAAAKVAAKPAPVQTAWEAPAAPKADVPKVSAAPKVPATPTSLPATPSAAQTWRDAEAPALAPSASSSSLPSPPLYADGSHVLIQGIEKKPELNGQAGLIASFDGGADRRYTVKVLGTAVRLREDKLSIVPPGYEAPSNAARAWTVEGANDSAETVDSVIAGLTAVNMGGAGVRSGHSLQSAADCDAKAREEQQRADLMEEHRRRDDANSDAIKRMPQGEVTATGRLVPTYHWVQVPPVASLPPGMEVWMPVGGLKSARIPSTWRLQVVAEGQVDSYRCDVGEHTPVIDVIIGASAAFGWEAHDIELLGEGKAIELQEEATVGSAGLFGRKLTARSSAP